MERQFTILYEPQDEDGFTGQCLELPAAISQGETIEELKFNMKEAIDLVLQYNLERATHKQTLQTSA